MEEDRIVIKVTKCDTVHIDTDCFATPFRNMMTHIHKNNSFSYTVTDLELRYY